MNDVVSPPLADFHFRFVSPITSFCDGTFKNEEEQKYLHPITNFISKISFFIFNILKRYKL